MTFFPVPSEHGSLRSSLVLNAVGDNFGRVESPAVTALYNEMSSATNSDGDSPPLGTATGRRSGDFRPTGRIIDRREGFAATRLGPRWEPR